jgi:metallo-beta-lactamase class B
MVDTPWDESQTERLLDWAEESLGVPVTHAIVTHSHQDNMGGIDVLHARDVATYGLGLTARLAREQGLAPPNHVFSSEMDLELGADVVEAWFPGGGHTRDNIVVWLPARRVLFGGCLIKSASARNMGNTADADMEAWPSSVQAVRERYPQARIIVPGHGAPGGDALLDNTLRLLAEHAQARQ